MDNSGTNVDQPDSATEDSNPGPQGASAMGSNPGNESSTVMGSNSEVHHHDEEEDEDLYFNVKDIDSSCDLPPLEIPQYDFGFDSKKS